MITTLRLESRAKTKLEAEADIATQAADILGAEEFEILSLEGTNSEIFGDPIMEWTAVVESGRYFPTPLSRPTYVDPASIVPPVLSDEEKAAIEAAKPPKTKLERLKEHKEQGTGPFRGEVNE